MQGPKQDNQGNARQVGIQETPYELFSLESLFPDPEENHTLIAYKASADPDKMYMHEAMK